MPLRPGDLCRLLDARRVEHVNPCPDGHQTGVVTDPVTGEVMSRPVRS